jgi:hypothetical protein
VNVAAHDLKDSKLLDEVHRSAEFTVIPADILGTGYRYTSKDGTFIVPWDWELRPVSADRVTSS